MRLHTVRDDQDLAAFDQLLRISFGSPSAPWEQWLELIGRDNLVVLREAERIVGGLGVYRMGQWFGGASVPLAGIAGVAIAPQARGTGRAKLLMKGVLEQLRIEGVPLAGLYASTTTLYRTVGFEQAGTILTYRVRMSDLPPGDHRLSCREFDPQEHEPLHAPYEARARGWTGHLVRNSALWTRVGRPLPARAFGYAVGDPLEGYVVFHQTTASDGLHFDVRIRDLVFNTAAAAQRLLALLKDLRSLGEELVWNGCASDPLVSLLPEQSQRVVGQERWMLRILNVPSALEARGYPSVEVDLNLGIRDPLFTENNRAFHLQVRKGKCLVQPSDRADCTLDIRGLAAMYSGFATTHTARAAGWLEGEGSALQMLFAGPEPWCCDSY